jgi:hypothetical protein
MPIISVSYLHRIDFSDLSELDLVAFGTPAARVSGRHLSRIGEVYIKLYDMKWDIW